MRSSTTVARPRERLAQHLAAEHLRAADVPALAAEQIDLQLLELEQLSRSAMRWSTAASRSRVSRT